MNFILNSCDLTDGLESFSQDLISSADDYEQLKSNYEILTGAAAFVKWIISEYCRTASNVAEAEIAETLNQFNRCLNKE